MENIKNRIHLKLCQLIDSELEKENPDTELIGECVDGILGLMPERSYQLTADRRKNNILHIVNEKPGRRFRSKVARILLAAAIIAALLIGSVFAYTIVEYKIHDYDTYSTVWTNIFIRRLDGTLTVGYVPDGFKVTDNIQLDFYSGFDYENDEGVTISISKSAEKEVNINTEYKKTSIITIDGIDYIFFGEETHGKGVIWISDDYLYSIVGILEDDELLKIAQSVS
ncbi:MAG: DUF4367 domain-containing protein [Firmicutes bacterium]|nr:DUF4367 domain-containing protein [Bacillota bacterium]